MNLPRYGTSLVLDASSHHECDVDLVGCFYCLTQSSKFRNGCSRKCNPHKNRTDICSRDGLVNTGIDNWNAFGGWRSNFQSGGITKNSVSVPKTRTYSNSRKPNSQTTTRRPSSIPRGVRAAGAGATSYRPAPKPEPAYETDYSSNQEPVYTPVSFSGNRNNNRQARF